jgi:hypothetical protein
MQLEQLLSLTWGELMMQKRFAGAAGIAILSYFLAQEEKDEDRRRLSLSILLKSIEELKLEQPQIETEKRDPSCSFCGRSEPEVRLAAGPDAFICDGCVSTLNEIFGKDRDP